MDEHFLYSINRVWTPEWLDKPMAVASSFDVWWPILIVVGLIMVICGGFRARACLLCIGICIGVVDGIAVNNLKDIIGKPRPHQVEENIRTLDLQKAKPRILAIPQPLKVEWSKPKSKSVRGGSLPSGHAANNFAIATVLALFYRWGWLYFGVAAFVSYSRVYVGSHYPVDVLTSAMLGVFLSFLTVFLLNAVWKRWSGGPFKSFKLRHPSLLGRRGPTTTAVPVSPT